MTRMSSFADHFSGHSAEYASGRPTYPDALFAALAELSPSRNLAWDAGTGNGQAATGLKRYFKAVIATDASAQQIERAQHMEGVDYRVARAEASGLPANAADLVTVAQALHWFNREQFYAEVRRVLRPAGVLAAWCYAIAQVTPNVDAVVERLYSDVVGPYWPPERHDVENGYADYVLPGNELPPPKGCFVEAEWNCEQFLRYLRSWSATQRYMQTLGADPLDQIREALIQAWGEPQHVKRVRWPLHARIARM